MGCGASTLPTQYLSTDASNDYRSDGVSDFSEFLGDDDTSFLKLTRQMSKFDDDSSMTWGITPDDDTEIIQERISAQNELVEARLTDSTPKLCVTNQDRYDDDSSLSLEITPQDYDRLSADTTSAGSESSRESTLDVDDMLAVCLSKATSLLGAPAMKALKKVHA